MNDLTIRKLQFSDFDAWHPLWVLNNDGKVKDQVTKHSWRNITNKNYDVHGLGAFASDGVMLGMLHYVMHPVVGSINPVCYMQDVFVHPDHRRSGIAKAMIEYLADIGQKENWNRIYWLAEGKNYEAQEMYQNIGVRLDFSLHIWPLAILKD